MISERTKTSDTVTLLIESEEESKLVDEAMKAVGAEPEGTLIIGDAIHDIAMGRAAGIHTIGVSWGFGERSELEAAEADIVVDNFSALERVLTAFSEKRATV